VATATEPRGDGALQRGAHAWLRPFDELALGDRYASRARTVAEVDAVRFAALTGAHADGAVRAPALLPLAYSIGLVPNGYVSALRRILDLRVPASVSAGDTIHVECEIVRLSPWTAEHGLVAGAWRIVDQDATELSTVVLEAVWRRARL
jgi:acyl dehydratase